VSETQRTPRWRWRDRIGDDRGVTTALLAVVLGGGVLLGATALVVDVGRLYVEREELQSGADAAALAIGRRCATAPTLCADEAQATAEEYANRNAKDGRAGIAMICGSEQDLGFGTCPAQPTNRTACIGIPAADIPYVEVHTATQLADGATLFPPAFAHAMAGNEGYEGTEVGACARAAWGAPTGASGIAIGVSECNWNWLTSSGVDLPTDESIVYLHDPQTLDPAAGSCPKSAGGKTAPGGFGYLTTDAKACNAFATVPTTWDSATGNNSHGCESPLDAYRTAGTAVPLPIYDTVTGTGTNASYHVIGFASFVVTGWRLSGGATMPSKLTGTSYCSGEARCLYGYFTSARLGTGTPGAGPNFGLTVVNMVG